MISSNNESNLEHLICALNDMCYDFVGYMLRIIYLRMELQLFQEKKNKENDTND